MKSNWSKLGFGIGLCWSLGFATRYLFIWRDVSQAVVFISIGWGLMGFAWLYDKLLDLRNKFDALEDWLDEQK